ncbi:MAG: adenylate/guanylate cyclase domain-containing protein [bacterium]|nr:adenylate/guanylate cyclase domain-containing protein [bacterium]
MPRLLVKDVTGEGSSHELREGTSTIGRGRDCTVGIAGLGISRRHASITVGPGGAAVLEDLGSKNGTLLNGARIERAEVRDGDEIGIGARVLVYRDDRPEGDNRPAEPTVRSVLKVEEGMAPVGEEPADLGRLRKAHRHLAVLYEVGRAVSNTLNLGDLLGALMATVFDVFHPDEAFIMLRDEATGRLKLRLFRSKIQSDTDGTVAVSRTILDRALGEGVAILTADASSDERFMAARSVLRFRMMSAMCAPLMRKGRALGVLHVSNRISSGEFSEDDLQLLSGIAGQAALAIENALLYANIQLEVRRRNNLQRYLPPGLVEQVIDGRREINLGGEIREVTVLFSDIRDFTRLSEELPPNEVVGTLNEYFSEMTRIAFRREGTIDKFIGDALVVVFGAAFTHGDDPSRAVETAIDMQRAVEVLNERWRGEGRATLRIGIGINTGDALYGNVGSEQRMELTVIGDAVNLAARLAEIAPGGGILVSGATWRAVEGRVRGERMEPVRVKGKAEPVEVHRVLAP